MQLSVHMFPVFDSSRDATDAYPETALQSRDSSYTGHRLSENSVAAATAAMSAQSGMVLEELPQIAHHPS
jgi:hypothetical protein